MRRILDDIFGVNPQISLFRALRLLKIKISGSGSWVFQKKWKRTPDHVLNTMTESDREVLSLILTAVFNVGKKPNGNGKNKMKKNK